MTFRIGEQYRANAGRAARVYPNMQRDRDYVLGTHDDEIDRLGLQQLRRRFFPWNTRSKAVKHHTHSRRFPRRFSPPRIATLRVSLRVTTF
jgi:hypothetical protein